MGSPTGETDPQSGEPKLLPPRKHVLLFDECDSLITDRNRVGMILAGQINTILSELERFEGVVVFTTNRLGALDPAIERRLSAKIEFAFPNARARLDIWKRMIPKKAPVDEGVDLEELAKIPLTGGHIKNAVLNAAREAAYRESTKITQECFLASIEKELEAAQRFDTAFDQFSPTTSSQILDKSETGELIKIKDIKKVKEGHAN